MVSPSTLNQQVLDSVRARRPIDLVIPVGPKHPMNDSIVTLQDLQTPIEPARNPDARAKKLRRALPDAISLWAYPLAAY